MVNNLQVVSYAGAGPGRPCAPGTQVINLLLVSRDPTWLHAVRGAATAMGGGGVFNCDARSALAKLASTASHYSHLLVDRNDAEGLLDEFADLATEIAAPDTDMLVLGSADTRRPHIRVIPAATSRSVLEALMATFFPPSEPAMDLVELKAALSSAMIETRYQPIVRVADRRPVGLEALARLNHPERGQLSPDRFVPQIEGAGLGGELTSLVSAIAFADLAGPFLFKRGLRMSVNFPLDVLLQPAALDRLEEQRIAAGLAADRIIIELTESRPVDDFPMLRRSLERLRGLGYGAAIDDVGPAVPQLAPLLELPFTSLKLDKVLVQDVLNSGEVRRFLEKTVSRAKAHGFTVVAEGVETDAIWNEMRDMGVDEIQGFLAARPLPVAAVPIWWDAWMGQETATA
jgi:EAL domain-containing protein (putative c-di-GMP-specific phosphodiesterase class I)